MNSSTSGAPTSPHPRSAAVSRTTCFSSVTSAVSICWKRGASSSDSEISKWFGAHTSLIATCLLSSISRTTRLAISTGWTPLRNVFEKRPSTRPPSRRSKSRRLGTIGGMRGGRSAARPHPTRGPVATLSRGSVHGRTDRSAVDDDRAGHLVVQGLLLPVPQHPQVIEQRDQPGSGDERSDADDQLEDRPQERLAPTRDGPVVFADPDPDRHLPDRAAEVPDHQRLVGVRHGRDPERPPRESAQVGGYVDGLPRRDRPV